MLLRFRVYDEVLLQLSTNVLNVLMVDVRATLFQVRRKSAGLCNVDCNLIFSAVSLTVANGFCNKQRGHCEVCLLVLKSAHSS